jgi:hypothetical protein
MESIRNFISRYPFVVSAILVYLATHNIMLALLLVVLQLLFS